MKTNNLPSKTYQSLTPNVYCISKRTYANDTFVFFILQARPEDVKFNLPFALQQQLKFEEPPYTIDTLDIRCGFSTFEAAETSLYDHIHKENLKNGLLIKSIELL